VKAYVLDQRLRHATGKVFDRLQRVDIGNDLAQADPREGP
jgi:hypothetical protein